MTVCQNACNVICKDNYITHTKIQKMAGKTSITIELDSEVRKVLEKRAKREMMSLRELVSDILRRSAILSKQLGSEKKTDDMFINIFSKSRRGRKAGKK